MEKASIRNRYVVLDALRGMAAIGVFLFHIHSENFFIMDGLWLLVDFFFILSGFVLYPQIILIRSAREGLFFIRKRIIRILPLPLLTILFMIFRQHNDTLQEIKTLNVDSIQSYIGAILLLQVISYQIVNVNLALWSLSTEFHANILSVFFHSNRMILFIILCALSLLILSIHFDFPKEIGLLAMSRTCLGFYIGIAIRKLEDRFSLSKFRITTSLVLLIPIFSLAGRTISAIFLAIPVFAIITVDCSKIRKSNMSEKFERLSRWLGRNSFGIYVWQIPINSIVQSEYIFSHFNLAASSITGQFMVVTCKLVILLIVSELTIRYFEEPVQSILRARLPFKSKGLSH